MAFIRSAAQFRQTDSRQAHFIEELKQRQIGTSVHFIPIHLHPYYRDKYHYRPEDFPVAYENYNRILSLPLHPRLSDKDVERVIRAVTEVVSKHRKRAPYGRLGS